MAWEFIEEGDSGLYVWWKHVECGRQAGFRKGVEPDQCNYTGCKPERTFVRQRGNRFRAAQVGEHEASAVAVKRDADGNIVDVSYCFNRPGQPLPEYLKQEGFEKQTFHSWRALDDFCKANGQVTDTHGDWHHDDGFYEESRAEKEKFWRDFTERYEAEREKIERAYPELLRKGR